MKRFQFSLQSVLNIELQLERMVDIRLSEAKMKLDFEKEKLKKLEEQLVIRDFQPGPCPIQLMENYFYRENQIRHQMEIQKREIHDRETEYLDILREKLVHTQKIKGLEKLEETERGSHQLQANRKAEKELLESLGRRRVR